MIFFKVVREELNWPVNSVPPGCPVHPIGRFSIYPAAVPNETPGVGTPECPQEFPR